VLFQIGLMCLVDVVSYPPLWDNPVTWRGLRITQVNKHPKIMFIVFGDHWPTTNDTRMPSSPTALCFDLNVNSTTFITVASKDIDSGHISSKRHGECTPFVQFGDNEVFASSRNLLIPCST